MSEIKISIGVPHFSFRTSEEGALVSEFVLTDPTQQMPLYVFNQSEFQVGLKLFANGIEKESFELSPHSEQHALIITCLAEFKNMADNEIVVWIERTQPVTIKTEIYFQNQLQGSYDTIFRFAEVGKEVSWIEAFERSVKKE